ncbi:MAG: LysM peptidoglycan-binding domain-containing protein [Deltaproteobacteria bacterium]|jgi:murein DD-endopeptidase MepM/ murein hydrolase activator NlpD|nr:LysM peptidoglycan-binding domain-containing protein [Deltaproteobacteria bacterium]
MKRWKSFIVCGLAMLTFALPAGAAGVPDGVVVVQQGQNLKAIAAQHKVSVEQLCQWNNLSSPDKIRVGQKLYVRPPDAAPTAVASATAASSAPAASSASASVVPSPQKQTKHAKPATPEPAPTVTNQMEMHAPDGVPENVKLELAKVGKTLVDSAAKNIMPNVKAKTVAPGSTGGFVASYMEVDASHIRTEVIPSTKPGEYVGSIRYVENQYECTGTSRAEALQTSCRMVKSRRMNELIRYEKGKWHY